MNRDDIINIIIYAGVVVSLWLWILCVTCCTSTKYVTVPEYHTEYITRTDSVIKADSVYVHDSIWVQMVGDTTTIYKYKYKDRLKYMYKTNTDTIIKRDSITVVNEIEKPLTSRQTALIGMGRVLLVLLGISVLGAVIWLIRKLT